MARIYIGNVEQRNIFEPGGQSPLDGRLLVNNYNDLLDPSTFKVYDSDGKATDDNNWYEGMVVLVLNQNKLYVLKKLEGETEPDTTDASCWVELNGGGGSIEWDDDIN